MMGVVTRAFTRRRAWLSMATAAAAAALIAAACGGGGGGSDFEHPRLLRFEDERVTSGQPHAEPGTPISYPSTPPYAGPHWSTPRPCRVYQEQQAFEGLVHTMEHGGVIIYFQPDVFASDEVNELRTVALDLLNDNKRIVLTPHRDIQSRIVLAAWGVLLPLDDFDETIIRDFTDTFENEGPEKIPRSNAC